ncbi:MAG: hypothetical protein U5K76_06875 [Woeseiaceae bacterium]|nr:hypothetical protein [Woeseiaceae bacterium]
MADLQFIEEFRIDTVTADRIRYRVTVNGGAERLASALDFNGDLERRADDAGSIMPVPGESPSLNYLYRP